MSPQDALARLRELPLPIAFTTKSVDAPIDTSNALVAALDLFAQDYGVTFAKPADGTVPGALGGGVAGAASALIPGFIIFGPIGMAIGGVVGMLGGGAIGKMLPGWMKKSINPAEAAKDAILRGDYPEALSCLDVMLAQIGRPGIESALRKMFGAAVGGDPKVLAGLYTAVEGIVWFAYNMPDKGIALLQQSLVIRPNSIPVLDLLDAHGGEIEELLVNAVDELPNDRNRTAALERLVRRRLDDMYLLEQLSYAYRRHYPMQAMQLDALLARLPVSFEWVLDTVRDAADAHSSRVRTSTGEILESIPERAAAARTVIARSDDWSAALERDQTATSAAEGRLKELEAEIERLLRDITDVQGRRDKAHAEMERAVVGLARGEGQITRFRNELASANERITELKHLVNTALSVEDGERLQTELTTEREKALSTDKRVQETESANRRQQSVIEDQRKQIEDLSRKHQSINLQVDAKVEQRTERQSTAAGRKKELKSLWSRLMQSYGNGPHIEMTDSFKDDLWHYQQKHPRLANKVFTWLEAARNGEEMRFPEMRGPGKGICKEHLDMDGEGYHRVYLSKCKPRRVWLRITPKDDQLRTIESIHKHHAQYL